MEHRKNYLNHWRAVDAKGVISGMTATPLLNGGLKR